MSEGFLRGLLKEYYTSVSVDSVPDISKREFGFGEFGKKISSRHLEFRSANQMNNFLRDKVPFYISYSSARYEFPSARPMENKTFIDADLIYEFDADDIPTSCKMSHDSWICFDCSASGKGSPGECVECGSRKLKIEEWVCPECLNETKIQTKKLLKIIDTDFGFGEGVAINFSGSKGYHIHVRGNKIKDLSKGARLELLDYLTATNLDFKMCGFYPDKKFFLCPKRSVAKGWQKKLLDGIESLLDEGNVSKIAVAGSVRNSAAEKILKEKDNIISTTEKGFLLSVPGVKGEKFWGSVLNYLAESETLDVDRQTSVDINKIIRVPETIHGSTGLCAVRIPFEELNSFDPLKDSVVMSDSEIGLANVSCPKFYLNGNWFGPFENESFSVPSFVAFYLLARKSGELV
ncbi:MAG: hypothetical protein COV47_03640 [Candidatus Diapherotrites archaeon CG11_big_fil_rev_8_21_14_0_20_37_9]|nr:MAG: hypothetical protein COV47_03640 [Candidatus Diapherotrites archaeon CG11_big_fil_rev_8_21_14_0_20_37_9]